jgi:N-acyl-D-amino-acid deacylase
VAWSLLLRGGTLVDGTGAPGRPADVAVEGDRIAAVAPGLTGQADRVLDVTGRVVAPGFIDMHSHSDLFYLACPSAESKIRQGVTTEVVGMCSFSPAPVRRDRHPETQGWIAGIVGHYPEFHWESFGQYLDILRSARPAVNVVHMVGHGALRIAAMGYQAGTADTDDLRAMERLLGEAMDAGAWGFSTGLVYPPSAYAKTEELVALARSMRSRHGFYFSHVRGESSMLLDSIAEAIRIGEEGGVPADRPRQGLRPRELAEARRRAGPHRAGAPPRCGRGGRRVPVQRGQHEDGQSHARVGARGRHGQAARAPG